MLLSHTKRRGFTLVEILIVLGVIALLTAILLPIFSRVRNSVRISSCASNLRQIGTAFRLYVDDHKGFHPSVNILPNPDCGWANQIYPYTRSTTVFQCPAYSYGEFRPGCPPSEPTNEAEFPFYHWDGSYNLNIFPSPTGRFNEMRLRAPSETILICDGRGSRGTYSNLYGGGSMNGVPLDPRDFSELGNRHNYGSNVAYADGHVKWKSYDALLDIKQWQPR